jgi:hypothetical protein
VTDETYSNKNNNKKQTCFLQKIKRPIVGTPQKSMQLLNTIINTWVDPWISPIFEM